MKITKLENLFDSFISNQSFNMEKDNGYRSAINIIKKTLPNMKSSPAWGDIYTEITKTEHRKNANQILTVWILFAVYLDKKGILCGVNKGLFAKNADAIEDYVKSTFSGKATVLRNKNFNPLSIIGIQI